MAKTVKGIRVNQLAKELDIPSKSILDKLKAEGLGDKVTNHMSLMPLGLAETVREWFASGGGGTATAVETATEAAVEDEAEHKATRARKKKSEHVEHAEHEAATEVAAPEVAATDVVERPAEAEQPVVAPTPEPVATEAPVAPEVVVSPPPAPVVAEGPSPVTPAPEVVAPVAPIEVAPPAPPAPVAPTPAPIKHEPHKPMRPAPRKAVMISKPFVPAPARIQGPKIVREEQPDVVPTPRRRTPIGAGPNQPSFVQAQAKGGRGVKASTDEETEDPTGVKKKVVKGRTLSSRRRDLDGRRGEADQKLREWSNADLEERAQRLREAHGYRTAVEGGLRKQSERGLHGPALSATERGQVEIEEPITVKTLSAALGIKTSEIMGKLLKKGVMTNVNASLPQETAESLALEWGVELRLRPQLSLEEELEQDLAARQTDPANLVIRPPVVTILGHVDHGKTSLLDKIRKANVAAGEAGGITQHIASWQVQLGEKRVTFIDTPGHQAFSSMRARGAAITDVVVLVVSAAEGVQPQTIESINHARAAKVPIVVAMNKIDRADANPDMILGQLAKEGLNPVEWGGDTEVVRTSAQTGQGIPELIEILDYQSALLELKADPTAPARGTVIESRMDEGLGPVATMLVHDGTLRVGDIVLAARAFGRVRMLLNDRGESIPEAGPSTPVIVSGLNSLPNAGDKFYAVEDMDQARSIAEDRGIRERELQLAGQNRVTAQDLMSSIRAGQTKIINLIIKGDVQGSVETLQHAVLGHNTEEVKVKVIHAAVGAINESDVELAAATRDENNSTVIVGFHVVPDDTARALAEQRSVEIRLYRVIYEMLDDLKKALSGMLEPEVREKLHGHAEIRAVFTYQKRRIAGCMVTDGHIQRGSKFRLIRDSVVIMEDLALESLKRVKDDVREVKSGFECGLKIANYDDIKVGDRLEAYSRELIRRTL